MIEEQWQEFCRVCFPPDLTDQQRIDLRRTFYGGASALYYIMLQIVDKGEESTPAGITCLSNLHLELTDFNREVKAGRA